MEGAVAAASLSSKVQLVRVTFFFFFLLKTNQTAIPQGETDKQYSVNESSESERIVNKQKN